MRRERNVSLSGDYQKITKINKHYIKNEIYFNSVLTPTLLSKVRMHLPNLSDYQLLEDRAVYISPVLLGKPLLDHNELSSSSKIDILNKYLKIIREFETLPLFMQLNLIQAENFYLVDDELMHRGVLIIEDADFSQRLTMQHLLKGISRFALNLIDRDVSLFNFKNYFRNLPYNNAVFSIDNIIEDVKDVYINDLFVEENFVAEEEVVVTSKFKYFNIKFASLAVIFLLLFTTASFAMLQAVQIKDSHTLSALFAIQQRGNNYLLMDESYSPSEYSITDWRWTVSRGSAIIDEFETENINVLFEEAGDYTVSLKVKDSAGNWSVPYEKKFHHEPQEELSDDLNGFNFQLALFDPTTHFQGSRSIKIDEMNNQFYTQNIHLQGTIRLKFQHKAQGNAQARLTLIGYKDGQVVSTTEHSLKLASTWQEQNIEIQSDPIDKLEFKFSDYPGVVNLDSFAIHSR